MKASPIRKAALLLSSLFATSTVAQEKWTDPTTGIEFYRQVVSSAQTPGGFEWGYALPGAPTGSNDEYIGYIVSEAFQNSPPTLLTSRRKVH